MPPERRRSLVAPRSPAQPASAADIRNAHISVIFNSVDQVESVSERPVAAAAARARSALTRIVAQVTLMPGATLPLVAWLRCRRLAATAPPGAAVPLEAGSQAQGPGPGRGGAGGTGGPSDSGATALGHDEDLAKLAITLSAGGADGEVRVRARAATRALRRSPPDPQLPTTASFPVRASFVSAPLLAQPSAVDLGDATGAAAEVSAVRGR